MPLAPTVRPALPAPIAKITKRCPCYNLSCSILLPIQPKVCMTELFTFQSHVLAHRHLLDSGSRLAVAELPRAPNSVLPCVSSGSGLPCPWPTCLSLALPGCAITLPASGPPQALLSLPTPCTWEGKGPTGGAVVALQQKCLPLSPRCCRPCDSG